ncbi:DUF4337 domain-containing protein [uncultured Thiodictyon sp.]|uniref:DUF4337 domain-containing protein n=1 Tax=uncultured Thiodictyon sp. TaxID=1846217 RepID=UPI0025D988CE|nr:DUF4337 domain-containing protein [uncultured Thiodictyon sp.]
MEILEAHEKIHEAGHGHGHHAEHGVPSANTKHIAVLISLLAALLAITDTAGKSAQNTSVTANIEAANLWSFFQAKSIRMTVMQVQADALMLNPPAAGSEQAQAVEKQIQRWKATAARYDSEPETGEGRKELSQKAKAAEQRRDKSLAAYHLFEYGAAALQLAIVLSSAAVVTGAMLLAWLSGGLGLIGAGFGLLGWFGPTLLHL